MTVALSNTQQSHLKTVEDYFDAQNNSNANAVVDLFSNDAKVVNVNFPPFEGKEAIEKFCQGLYNRTSSRHFQIISTALADQQVMAHWNVEMRFRPHVKIGPFELEKGFDVALEGVNVFTFDNNNGAIKELKIFHETSTVAQLAKENAKG